METNNLTFNVYSVGFHCIGLYVFSLLQHLISVPDLCGRGYYGPMCTEKCNCFPCDKATGSCTSSSECLQGFYGANCDTECHCLNGAACDRDTGRCDIDDATGLSLCEPGYTGEHLENCQQCKYNQKHC